MSESTSRRRAAEFLIDRNGCWHHRGAPVQRESMIRLFAAMLAPKGGGYVLRTPEYDVPVSVEDAPIVLVDAQVIDTADGPQIWMLDSLGERYLLGAEHPLYLRIDAQRNETRAYLSARDGMPALIHRNLFYRLVEIAEFQMCNGENLLGLRSAGCFYALE
jgi:uncharacterized protein